MCVVRVACFSVMTFLCEDNKLCCESYVCQSCLFTAWIRMCDVRVTCVRVMYFLCEDNKMCCKSYVCQSHVFPLRGQECVL